ncbi:MAG: hypothetical protein ABSH49_14350 [Bryobacteraceae bacterium]|jgi:hypothetical protein
MTTDERLAKLAERHEALTQTVELLAAENRQATADNRQRDRRMGEIMEAIASLAHVAQIREQRIERLEDNP